MKKALTIIVALIIWAAILILCGEKSEDMSWTTFYIWKSAALVCIAVCSRWLDKKCIKEQNE